jgi:hypothetical protein
MRISKYEENENVQIDFQPLVGGIVNLVYHVDILGDNGDPQVSGSEGKK